MVRTGGLDARTRASPADGWRNARGLLIMPATPPQLEPLVDALPHLSDDALRTVLEVCVARMKVRSRVLLLCSYACLVGSRRSQFDQIVEVLTTGCRNKK